MKRIVIPWALVVAASFVYAGDDDTIRICDASGCSDRAKSSATFQVEADDPVMVQRTAALVDLANKDPRAAWDLGLRYFRGDGVRKDAYQALRWMRDAGERGNTQAQLAVGRFYLMGLEEMGSDPAEAETWLSMAASKGNKEAQELLKEAQAAQKNEQALYQWRETHRKTWNGYWTSGYRYHWTWGPRGWYDR